MKRAVIYARVSTERQADEGLSVESQIEACRRKAADLGAAVVAVYRDDGISGTTDARPGFRAAIHHCARGVDLLICWSSSRFARDQHDAITYKRELAAGGTRLVYASQAPAQAAQPRRCGKQPSTRQRRKSSGSACCLNCAETSARGWHLLPDPAKMVPLRVGRRAMQLKR